RNPTSPTTNTYDVSNVLVTFLSLLLMTGGSRLSPTITEAGHTSLMLHRPKQTMRTLSAHHSAWLCGQGESGHGCGRNGDKGKATR
ncbi:hypothetical protein BJV77DRAFT_1033357, partial [Russula vinacea]